MLFLIILLFAFGALYAAFSAVAIAGLIRGGRHPSFPEKPQGTLPYVTVLVPAKNEEQSIGELLECLQRQDFPGNKLEIIVIDDDSTDGTTAVVRKLMRKNPAVKLLSRKDITTSEFSGKKGALLAGLDRARGEIILTTDADCVMGPEWVRGMVLQFNDGVGFVAGRTHFKKKTETSLRQKLESVEFLGIISAAAGLMEMGWPVTCNASNLGYLKRAFNEAGGYGELSRVLSGDDDLLLQKVALDRQYRIRFSFDPRTFVYTEPTDSLKEFLRQRVRWASKILHYPNRLSILGLASVYLYFILLILAVPITFFGIVPMKFILGAWLLKIVPDGMIIARGGSLFGRRDLILYYPLAEFFHILYILLVVPAGFFGFFQWKGLKNTGASALGRFRTAPNRRL